jgi:hypothetical protein
MLKSVGLLAAVILALEIGCSGTVQESEERQLCSDPGNVALDADGSLSEAFNAPAASRADSVGEAEGAFFTICNLRVDNPHNSMHVPDTVNVVATVICLRPVQKIELLLGLARDGHEVARRLVSNAGKAMLAVNVAEDPCVDGEYEGAAAAAVVFPPGSSPPENTLHANSSWISITCP